MLHSNVETIKSVRVNAVNGGQELLNEYYLEPQYHFLKINLQQSLVLGTNYSLYIEYSNKMNEGPMKRGIWRGWYVDSNGVER